jgi:hypothetical protein
MDPLGVVSQPAGAAAESTAGDSATAGRAVSIRCEEIPLPPLLGAPGLGSGPERTPAQLSSTALLQKVVFSTTEVLEGVSSSEVLPADVVSVVAGRRDAALSAGRAAASAPHHVALRQLFRYPRAPLCAHLFFNVLTQRVARGARRQRPAAHIPAAPRGLRVGDGDAVHGWPASLAGGGVCVCVRTASTQWSTRHCTRVSTAYCSRTRTTSCWWRCAW